MIPKPKDWIKAINRNIKGYIRKRLSKRAYPDLNIFVAGARRRGTMQHVNQIRWQFRNHPRFLAWHERMTPIKTEQRAVEANRVQLERERMEKSKGGLK